MSELKSALRNWLWRHPSLLLVLLVFLLLFADLSTERCLGRLALGRWRGRMALNGEVLAGDRIPPPSAQGAAFSNQFHEAVTQLPPGLSNYAGRVCAMVPQEPGIARRGSQEPKPLLAYRSFGTNRSECGSWAELEMEIRLAAPALQSLRALLRDPPLDTGQNASSRFAERASPVRDLWRSSQAFESAAMLDLHQGNLAAANSNLISLAECARVDSNEAGAGYYAVRTAVLARGVEVAWDALQAEGWTDEQLLALQEAFQCEILLAQLPKTLEAERALLLSELDWLSAHSYLDWVARNKSAYESLGYKVPVSPEARAIWYWRGWVFHPLWRYAWADQEKLAYLQYTQKELDVLRKGAKTGDGCEMVNRIRSLRTTWRPPVAAWRFYLFLPWAGQMSDKIGGSIVSQECPYPDFSAGWARRMKDLTLCQMLIGAICVKRYEVRHGKPPTSLAALVPEFLARLPRDYMDGEPLRYKLRDDGSYCLYSIADNAKDDQGMPFTLANASNPGSAWNGSDWVWPRVATSGLAEASDSGSRQ